MDGTIDDLIEAFRRAEEPVVFTGLALGRPDTAEVSAFRREWTTRASLDALMTQPTDFWEYIYPAALEVSNRQPGDAHQALSRLQRAGYIAHHITQSVDRLHQKAGSIDIIEVYGNLLTAHCGRCGERYGITELGPLIEAADDGVPRCTNDGCGFPLRPTGTLWGEPLPPVALQKAWELAGTGDLFVAFDCDLRTAPLSLLPSVPLTRKSPLYLVSDEASQYDRYATVIRASARELLPELADRLIPHE